VLECTARVVSGGSRVAFAEAEVTDDTRVLVAHSLGTVLSYAALAAHDDWPVHTFVTLGAPLAAPMVFNGLEPAPVDGRGAWPGSVQRWVNVRALNDKACETCLAHRPTNPVSLRSPDIIKRAYFRPESRSRQIR